MFGVCGGAEEILVCIRGFNIEICREDIIIIDGNSDVKKMYGFLDCSVVNLMVGWVLLSVSMKSVSLSCPCVQIIKMSSMKRHHTRGLCGALSRALVSRTPIKILA